MGAIGIDWVAVLVLLAAYVFSTVKSVKLSLRLGVFSAAFFGIAAYRFWRGATAGMNLFFVAVAVFFGVRYAWDAIKANKVGS